MTVEAVPEFNRTDRMALALRHAGLTNQDMADYLGVTRETVSRWVNGRSTPNRGMLRLWAIRTGVPLLWIETGAIELPRLDSNQQPFGYMSAQVRHARTLDSVA
jgi:transcriptional regulator with XRE-family HTH domain